MDGLWIVAAQTDQRPLFRRSQFPDLIGCDRKPKLTRFLALGKAMQRRDFIKSIGGAAVAWPLAARAQHSAKVPRIGFLRFGPASAYAFQVDALRAGLRQLGYVEG